MVPNSNIILDELLKDSKYRKEWEENIKLRMILELLRLENIYANLALMNYLSL
jgi:hypothetical protein